MSLYRHAQRDNGLPSMVFSFVLFITWHFETASLLTKEREPLWYLFCHTVLELASLEKKIKIFDFSKLGFCKAEVKSEDIFVPRRVRAWLLPLF